MQGYPSLATTSFYVQEEAKRRKDDHNFLANSSLLPFNMAPESPSLAANAFPLSQEETQQMACHSYMHYYPADISHLPVNPIVPESPSLADSFSPSQIGSYPTTAYHSYPASNLHLSVDFMIQGVPYPLAAEASFPMHSAPYDQQDLSSKNVDGTNMILLSEGRKSIELALDPIGGQSQDGTMQTNDSFQKSDLLTVFQQPINRSFNRGEAHCDPPSTSSMNSEWHSYLETTDFVWELKNSLKAAQPAIDQRTMMVISKDDKLATTSSEGLSPTNFSHWKLLIKHADQRCEILNRSVGDCTSSNTQSQPAGTTFEWPSLLQRHMRHRFPQSHEAAAKWYKSGFAVGSIANGFQHRFIQSLNLDKKQYPTHEQTLEILLDVFQGSPKKFKSMMGVKDLESKALAAICLQECPNVICRYHGLTNIERHYIKKKVSLGQC